MLFHFFVLICLIGWGEFQRREVLGTGVGEGDEEACGLLGIGLLFAAIAMGIVVYGVIAKSLGWIGHTATVSCYVLSVVFFIFCHRRCERVNRRACGLDRGDC